ncbi:MAG: hypothetical protein M0Z41_08695 [Peptococcaceae bacterium]|jgi:hypothetical protein|nr:hypothetical protein [Peptococcaceae bacterium]
MNSTVAFVDAFKAFRQKRGLLKIVFLNYIANFLVVALINIDGTNIIHMVLNPRVSTWTNQLLAYRFIVPFAIVVLIIEPFVLSATLNSLPFAIKDHFVIADYFRNGLRYFSKSLLFKSINYMLFIGAAMISLAIMALLFRALNWVGLVMAIAFMLPGWIYLSEFLMSLMVKYVAESGTKGNLAALTKESLIFVNRNYFSMVTLLVIVSCIQMSALILGIAIGDIPVIGMFLPALLSVGIGVLSLLTILFAISIEPSGWKVSIQGSV